MINIRNFCTIFILSFSLVFSIDGSLKEDNLLSPVDPFRQSAVAKIGDNPFPTNPMSDRQKVLSIREGLRAPSQTMVVLLIGIFILQVYGAITLTYPQYRSLEQYQGTRVLLTSYGKILKRSLMMMGYPFTAFGNLLLPTTTGIL